MDQRSPSLDPHSHTWLELGEVQRLLLDSYPGIVLGLGLDGRIRWLNPAGAERLGYSLTELNGRDLIGSLIHPEDLAQRAAQLSEEFGELIPNDVGVLSVRLRHGASSDEHDWALRHRDGSLRPARLSVGALRDHHGHVTGWIIAEPATRAGGEVRPALFHHDSLTGLPTRAVLADRAEMAIQRASRQQSVVALMLIEIVGFDALCEEMGPSVGDDVLRATASRLHFELRKTDTAVRLDRGQFAAMLVDLHQAEEIPGVTAKIQQALSARVNVGVGLVHPSARIGVAWFPAHGDQLLPLLEKAEAAMAGITSAQGGLALAPLPSE